MRFIVPGVPVPKARPRFTRAGHTYTPDKTVAHEAAVRLSFKQQDGWMLSGEVAVRLLFVMPIPQRTSAKAAARLKWHSKRPDVDNLSKTVLDALNGLAYADDGHVAKLEAVKIYGAEPRTEIEIEELKHSGESDAICK